MSADLKVSLEALGQPELERRLNALPGMVIKRLVRSSLRKGAKVIHEAVKPLVPKDTGALLGSIKVRSGGFSRGWVQMRIFTGDLKALGYRVTKRLGARGGRPRQGFPPAAIEFGYVAGGKYSRSEQLKVLTDRIGRTRGYKTVTHTRTGGRRIPARSFMRGPLEANRDKATAAIAEDLWEGLREEAGKETPVA